jgi:DNA-binding response OmpR family regulator
MLNGDAWLAPFAGTTPGNGFGIDQRTVDANIGQLCKALIQDREKDSIKTVRGLGTRLMETFADDDLNQS